jgi:hypothetical protein
VLRSEAWVTRPEGVNQIGREGVRTGKALSMTDSTRCHHLSITAPGIAASASVTFWPDELDLLRGARLRTGDTGFSIITDLIFKAIRCYGLGGASVLDPVPFEGRLRRGAIYFIPAVFLSLMPHKYGNAHPTMAIRIMLAPPVVTSRQRAREKTSPVRLGRSSRERRLLHRLVACSSRRAVCDHDRVMEGQLIQKKDCSAAVQAGLPEAKALAQVRTPSSGVIPYLHHHWLGSI